MYPTVPCRSDTAIKREVVRVCTVMLMRRRVFGVQRSGISVHQSSSLSPVAILAQLDCRLNSHLHEYRPLRMRYLSSSKTLCLGCSLIVTLIGTLRQTANPNRFSGGAGPDTAPRRGEVCVSLESERWPVDRAAGERQISIATLVAEQVFLNRFIY